MWDTLSGETLSGEIFVNESDRVYVWCEKFRPIKVKVSLIKVQMNLRGKQVIYTKSNYLVGRNFSGEIFITFQKIRHIRPI